MGTKIKLLKLAIITFLVFILLPIQSFSQQAEKLFQKGLMMEEGEGNLPEAINIYKSIVNKESDDRYVQANALLHIGLCYEKLGKKEASKSYKQLVEEFGDQQEILQIAKQRLALIKNLNVDTKNRKYKNPEYTLVNFEHDLKYFIWQTYDFSSDGKYVVFTSQGKPEDFIPNKYGELYLSDITGTVVKNLSEFIPKNIIQIRSVSISPTENLIAFWVTAYDSNSNYHKSIYTMRTDGSDFKLVKKNTMFAYDLLWSADGKTITYLGIPNEKKIFTIDLNGKVVKEIPYNSDLLTGLCSLSPDGKWISSYRKVSSNPDKRNTDLWLISADGKKDIRLTNRFGLDAFGTFSADGKSLYFVSDRNGGKNIFKIKIDIKSGKVIGDPFQITNYKEATIYLPKINKNTSQLFYMLSRKSDRIDAVDMGSTNKSRIIARGVSPQISPDGETVYYKSVSKEKPGIFSVPFSGGESKKITDIVPNDKIVLSPDGKYLTFAVLEDSINSLKLLNLSNLNDLTIKSFNYNKELNKSYGGRRENINPSWSYDSKTLVFVIDTTLYSYSLDEQIVAQLAKEVRWEFNSVAWSPDGKFISGIGYLESKFPDVLLVSFTTKEVIKVSREDEKNYKSNINWHASSKKLTYAVNRYRNIFFMDGLYQAYVDGKPSEAFIDQPKIKDLWGRWDPNGRCFYFRTMLFHGTYQLNIFDDETKEIKLFSNEFFNGFGLPSGWSADGKRMVRSVNKDNTKLWMMEKFE